MIPNILYTEVFSKLLLYFFWVLKVKDSILHQTKKTTLALVDSFSEEKNSLYFYPGSIIPLITSQKPIINIDDNVWKFHENTFMQNHSEKKQLVHLPYISASLYKGADLIADISEWIQSIKATGIPPASTIILAWAYSTNMVLDSKLSEYSLSVITDDGDDETIKLA